MEARQWRTVSMWCIYVMTFLDNSAATCVLIYFSPLLAATGTYTRPLKTTPPSSSYCAWAEFEASKKIGFNRPFFTYFILIVCTCVLIASIGVNGWAVEPININPMIGPSAETLVQMGAKQTSLIVNDEEWFRLVSPMVLHAGLIHYFLNMLALWFIGGAVEKSHGIFPTLVLFISRYWRYSSKCDLPS